MDNQGTQFCKFTFFSMKKLHLLEERQKINDTG